VRLVATTITGTGGSLNVNGGPKGIGTGNAFNGGDGGVGRIRVETYTLSASIVFSTFPSIIQPGSVSLSGTPSLTITAVAGVSVPANPAGTFGKPDVILPTATGSSISVALSAANVPTGAGLTLQVTPLMGDRPAALSGTLSGTTHTFTGVTIPLDQPFRVDAEASFNLTAWLEAPIKYAGEDVATVQVMASLGGPSQVRYFTASGKEVPAEILLALGLTR
jgi:hypothetical protein